MHGWNGKILRVNLTRQKAAVQEYPAEMAMNFMGGRGFAAKVIWDEVKPGTDPLSPDNKLIFAAGPLTGFPIPSSGKLVVAAKSPLTGGYGDGSLGSQAAVQMRKAGYDAIIVEGRAESPTALLIQGESTQLLDAKELWGMGSFEAEQRLRDVYGQSAGILTIGPAGEKLVKFANIISQGGRAGGRPGIGAVMGSKNLKAVVIIGLGELKAADPNGLRNLGVEAYREILTKPNYGFWKRQGTMSTLEWSQENSVLPTFNYREGIFDYAELIGGFAMEKIKVSQRGCPNCNMTCGNVVEDANGEESELDYENVAMLGANIGIGDLKKVSAINRMADDLGLDTISLGNVIGFAMEASEKNIIEEKISWGDYESVKALTEDITYKRGLGSVLSEGVKFASLKFGGETKTWAMHVKGLEISGYDCHAAPAMALSYGTCPLGAHHKDAWVISWEVKAGREGYGEGKVDKVIELQRLRGGLFEFATVCRLPWVEVGFELEWYPKFLKAATGIDFSWSELHQIADRVYTLIRAFWVREYGKSWSKEMDIPPERWFKDSLTKGPFKGAKLDKEKYEIMLQMYYRKRGWDERGIPTKATLNKLGLKDVISELQKKVELKS
ncbi:MAG: aldehyde ferredoxin oxidoreductase family protein [Candidatus Bathyarchaeota archaeon]|nr:aldehyde ferredoxin oxidoreductase family protein [Candidatus Bathyarchaeota archaeon]